MAPALIHLQINYYQFGTKIQAYRKPLSPEKWKAHEKQMKSEKHLKSEKHTSKVKAPEKWKAHEKQMTSEKQMKSKKHLISEKPMKNKWKVKSTPEK